MHRVLLIENDGICRADIADVLSEHGYVVEQASNGAEALEVLAASSATPDAILLDLLTPVLDGWGFRRAQSEDPRYRDIPVVLMSGLPDIEAQTRSLGVAAGLKKPFDLHVLLSTLEAACSSSPTRH